MNCSSKYANKRNKIVKYVRKNTRIIKKNRRIIRKDTRVKKKIVIVNWRKWSWICVNEKIFSLKTMNVVHLTFNSNFLKKSRNHKTNFRKLNEIYIKYFQINETSIIDFFVFRINQSINCRISFSNFRHLINKQFFCIRINSFSNDFYNIYFFKTLKHRLIKKKIKIIYNFISNHQINKQSFKTLNKKLWISFRFVFVSTICSFRWHLMNSLQRLINLFQWNFFIEFVITISKTYAFDSLHFYEFKKKWIYYIRTIRKQWHKKLKKKSINLLINSNKFVFFAIFCRCQCVNILSIDFFVL